MLRAPAVKSWADGVVEAQWYVFDTRGYSPIRESVQPLIGSYPTRQ